MAVKNFQIAEVHDMQGTLVIDARIVCKPDTMELIHITDKEGNVLPEAKVTQTPQVTMSCDAEGCPTTSTFDPRNDQIHKDIAWLRSVRKIFTADGRELLFCSDACNVAACTAGTLNMPTRKVIDIAEGADAMKKAALQAAIQKQSDDAIKNVRLD